MVELLLTRLTTQTDICHFYFSEFPVVRQNQTCRGCCGTTLAHLLTTHWFPLNQISLIVFKLNHIRHCLKTYLKPVGFSEFIVLILLRSYLVNGQKVIHDGDKKGF